MITATNKSIIRRLTDSFNRQDMSVLDELVDINYVDHAPFPDQAPGLEGIKQAHKIFYQGFPDIYETIEDIYAEDDKVIVRWTCTGTHLGNFVSIPPTGKHVTVAGIDIYRVVDGKVVENWHNVDVMGLLYQLGVYKPSLIYIASFIQGLKYRLRHLTKRVKQ